MTALDLDQFQAAFDSLDSGVIVVNSDHLIVCWNFWFTSASGITSEQAVGRRLSDLFPARSLDRLSRSVSEALSLGSSSVLTHSLNPNLFPLRTRAGLSLIYNLSVRPFGADRPHSHCLLQIVDVTVATQRERVLRERQNARYDAVVESAADVILTLDANGVVQFANPAAVRETKFERAELVGRSPRHLFEKPDEWDNFWVALLNGNDPVRPVELIAKRKDGSRTFFDVSASRWLSEGRIFVTAILRDMSERHAAEEELRELNLNLEQRVAERTQERDRIWQVSLDMLGVAAADGTWISINPAWTTILGWHSDDILGKTSDWLEPPDNGRNMREAFARVAEPEQALEFESSFRTSSGEYRILSWTAVNVEGLLYCVARDITEQRNQQEALDKAEEALRQSQKMEAVGQLTGGIAHDFNNLLTIITGNVDMARRALLAGEASRAARAMDNAQKGSERAAALTQRLLAFSRRQPLAPKSINIDKLVTGMADLLHRSLGETIQLETISTPGLWRVEADPNQLEAAVLNLAVNARDAMPNGGKLTIETANARLDEKYAAAHAEVAPGNYVVMAITDTGHGMPKEILGQVFDPFFTTKEVGKGTGLGLSMVYGFVKQSGGHIKVYSEPGQGTTVKLYLPRLLTEGEIDEIKKLDVIDRAKRRHIILVVEDDDDVRAYTVEILRELGYHALEARDAQSALKLIEHGDKPIDLLFTDVVMPGMSGPELADKAHAMQPGLKILFTSGYTRNAVVHGGRLGAGVEMIAKPFTYQAVAEKISNVLEAGHTGRMLVIEYDPTVRMFAVEGLQSVGYSVDEAATAAEGLWKIRAAQGRYDAILLDLLLPDKDGEALALELRAMHADLPILLLSIERVDELKRRFVDDRCTDILSKPYNATKLQAALEILGVRCKAAFHKMSP